MASRAVTRPENKLRNESRAGHSADVPEESRVNDDEEEQLLEKQLQMLDHLGMSLAKSRSEAINARATSSIENDWLEDEEHYEGIDDINRGEMSSWSNKPLGQAYLEDPDSTQSSIFFNITRPYVDSASARVGDMLLPTEDKGWSLKPTPIPDMINIAKGEIPDRIKEQINSQVLADQTGQVAVEDLEDERMGRVQQIEQQVIDGEAKELKEAKDKAARASKQIEDWHVECQYNSEMRKVIEDASKVGTGIMKGPIIERRVKAAFIGGELVREESLQPISRRVDYYNCYPDLGCGQSIHNGSYHWERDDITERTLRELMDDDSYIREQIEAVLKEGQFEATKEYTTSDSRLDRLGLIKRDKSTLFEIWYYYGGIKKEDMEAAGCDCSDFEGEPKMDAHIIMINNRVIRASENILDDGAFPYDYMPWQARIGLPWGIGVARQIRAPQQVINGAGRNLMDNAGMAGGPMWIFNTGLVEPLDGMYEIAPRKGWMVSEDTEDPIDVNKAFTYITMPMMQEDLQAIIQMGMKMAEDISGLPSLLQGQQGENQETLGATQIRNNNGSSTLRRIARLYDDRCTTPQIRKYYDYILQHGEDDQKGDFVIEARGSSALVERDLKNQSIMDMINIVQDPTFGLDKRRWALEYLKSQRLDPEAFKFDDDEWETVLTNLQQPQDTSVQVAQIRAEMHSWIEQFRAQVKGGEIQNENSQREREREFLLTIKQMDQMLAVEIKSSEEAGKQNDTLTKVKSHLAEVLLTLEAQIKMSEDGKAPQVANPVVEPEGRAPDDQAFQK